MDITNELQDDEEEILVYVEFDGMANNMFDNDELQLDILGIDTDSPIIQVNGRVYEGTYENSLGTCLFFEKDENETVDDPIFDTKSCVKYFKKTKKLLKMQRVFIKQHTDVVGDSNNPSCIPNIDTIKKAGVPLMYQKEALHFWNSIRDKRLRELNDYLKKQKIREEKRAQGIEPDSDTDEESPFAVYKYKDPNNEHLSTNLREDIEHNASTALCDIQIKVENTYDEETETNFTETRESSNSQTNSPSFSFEKTTPVKLLKEDLNKKTKRNGNKLVKSSRKINLGTNDDSSKEKKESKQNKRKQDTYMKTLQEVEELLFNMAQLEQIESEMNENPQENNSKESVINDNSANEKAKLPLIDVKIQKQLKREAKTKEILGVLKREANKHSTIAD